MLLIESLFMNMCSGILLKNLLPSSYSRLIRFVKCSDHLVNDVDTIVSYRLADASLLGDVLLLSLINLTLCNHMNNCIVLDVIV